MAISVSEVNPSQRDIREIVASIVQRELLPEAADSRTSWLYEQSPDGQAICHLALDGPKPVGMAAAFPRTFEFSGRKRAWVLGDFAIDRQYRALGPAVQMQRALLQSLESRGESWYDYPSSAMQAVYARIGITSQRKISRWTYPLSVEPGPELTRSLARFASRQMLGLRSLLKRSRTTYRVEPLRGEFPGDVAGLASSASNFLGLLGARSPEFLEWRFHHCPGLIAQAEVLRDNSGKLRGYVVTAARRNRCVILDWIADSQDGMFDLMLHTCRKARRELLEAVDCALPNGHLSSEILGSLGFIERESSSFFAGGPLKDAPWYVLDGDRES